MISVFILLMAILQYLYYSLEEFEKFVKVENRLIKWDFGNNIRVMCIYTLPVTTGHLRANTLMTTLTWRNNITAPQSVKVKAEIATRK